MTPFSTEDRNQDHDISGTLCVLGGLSAQAEGTADCTCFDSSCGLYSGDGRVVSQTTRGFDYCEMSIEYDEEMGGQVKSELDLKLTRLLSNISPLDGQSGKMGDRMSDDMICYRTKGFIFSAVQQANSENENGDGTCKGQISMTSGLQKKACRVAANGFARAIAGTESLGNASVSMGSKFGVHGDIVNNAYSAAAGYKTVSKRTRQIRKNMGPVCAQIGHDIAAVEAHPFVCDELSVLKCEGTHSGVPIVVTRLSDGAQCEATADVECESNGGDDASLISSECQCNLASEPEVDESSCR